jgi:prepilin-type N-terminal cleavage/methylation domain-containing protein
MKRGHIRAKRRQGFTLVEVLAALAITSVIIAAIGALVHNVALSFERGTRGVSEGERLILAVERLAADIGSARFVQRATEIGTALAFTGEPAKGEEAAKMIFVGAGGSSPNHDGEEVVSLTVEQEGEVTRLVRRRAPWLGPRTRFEDLTLSDPVILLEGKFLMSFAFGRTTRDSAVIWNDDWKGQSTLPRFVRLILRDRTTGTDLLAGADFVVHADASDGCAQNGASSCVAASSGSKARRSHDD